MLRLDSGQRFESVWVDLSSHNTNPPGVFDGAPYELRDSSDVRDEKALASIRAFLEEFGIRPTAKAWTSTGMTPSEKTIRRRFGSFKVAVATARLGLDNK